VQAPNTSNQSSRPQACAPAAPVIGDDDVGWRAEETKDNEYRVTNEPKEARRATTLLGGTLKPNEICAVLDDGRTTMRVTNDASDTWVESALTPKETEERTLRERSRVRMRTISARRARQATGLRLDTRRYVL
jgi:hypothetical protein